METKKFKMQPRINDAWELIYANLFEPKFEPESILFTDTFVGYELDTANKQLVLTLVVYKEGWDDINKQAPNIRNTFIDIFERTGDVISTVNIHDLVYKGYKIKGDYSSTDLMKVDLVFSFESSNIDWK